MDNQIEKEIDKLKEIFKQANSKALVMALVSHEKGIDNIEVLNYIYDEWLDSPYNLLNDYFNG